MGIRVGGMRVPTLDDDYGIPGVRRRFVGQPLPCGYEWKTKTIHGRRRHAGYEFGGV